MKNKICYFLLLILIIAVCLPLPVSAATYSGTCGTNVTWLFDTATGVLTISGTGSMTDYSAVSEVPWQEYTFQITSIIINDGVESIGKTSFRDCSSAESVAIPITVTSINVSAFRGCSSLKEVALPDALQSIEAQAFNGCTCLEQVSIPASVINLGATAFSYCTKIKKVVVAADNAYYSSDNDGVLFNKDKSQLLYYPSGKSQEKYTIPQSVQEVGDSAFLANENLKSVKMSGGVLTIGKYTFSECHNLSNVEFPNSLNSILDYAFHESGVSSVILPYGIKSVGDRAFEECQSLNDVYIPNSVTSLGRYAFSGCSSLLDVTVPGSVGEIKDCLFCECTALETVAIEEGITYIGERAFSECSNLKEIVFPESLDRILTNAFDFCEDLTSLIIPENVTSISSPFKQCTSLKEIYFYGDAPIVDNRIFSSVPNSLTVFHLSDKTGWTNSWHGIETAVFTPEIESGTFNDNIQWKLFVDRGRLVVSGEGIIADCPVCGGPWCSYNERIKEVIINNGITEIGKFSFNNCYLMEKLRIPEEVSRIGVAAFSCCTSLKEVNLPSSLEYYEIRAISYCDQLESINVAENNETFCSENGVLYLKDKTQLIIYPSHKKGSSFLLPRSVVALGPEPFYNTIYLNEISVEEGNTTFACQDGILYNKDLSELVTYPAGKTETTHSIGNQVKKICCDAFSYNEVLTEIKLNENLEVIEDGAFQCCRKITEISIPAKVNTIEQSAFGSCAKLAKVYFYGNTPEVFAKDAFNTCANNLVLYHLENKEGWTNPYNGYATAVFIDSSVLLGDVNGDKIIDAADAIKISLYDVGLVTLSDNQISAADVNKDNCVDAADAIKVLKYDAGLINVI